MITFRGGFDLVDLLSDSNEDAEEGDDGSERDGGSERDEGSERDDRVPFEHKGKPECPVSDCGRTFKYGEEGLKRLESHVRRQHRDAEALVEEARERYKRANRNFKTPAIPCDRCGQDIHGNAANLKQHQRSSACRDAESDAGPSHSRPKRKRT